MVALLVLDYLGTLAFAISGGLKAVRREMDLFGLIVLAVVTAIGGGTMRDVMLGQRPFWFEDATYILLSLVGALTVVLLYRLVSRKETMLLWFDAVGLGAFTVIGASKAMAAELGLVPTVVLAVLTGVGGGIIRDVLAGDVPVVLRKEVYASAGIAGAIVYWALSQAQTPEWVAMTGTTVLVTVIRLVCLHYGIGLPKLTGKASGE